jgi:hypothetical protein
MQLVILTICGLANESEVGKYADEKARTSHTKTDYTVSQLFDISPSFLSQLHALLNITPKKTYFRTTYSRATFFRTTYVRATYFRATYLQAIHLEYAASKIL